MHKIVITGPESTGKSTLTKQLADYFKVEMAGEFARNYLEKINREYDQNDLTEITKGQMALEDKALKSVSKFVICDTSLEVIKIWSGFKFGSCDKYIIDAFQTRQPDLYLLMQPDLPWTPDPLRENPDEREKLFELYKQELIVSKVPFYEILGSGKERFEMAKEALKNHLA